MKDRYCSYYTESEDITSYMVSKLRIAENDLILEPSAGEGTFIDAIISQRIPVRIDALDMKESAVLTMQKKYANMQDVTVRLADTLLDEQLDGMQAAGPLHVPGKAVSGLSVPGGAGKSPGQVCSGGAGEPPQSRSAV